MVSDDRRMQPVTTKVNPDVVDELDDYLSEAGYSGRSQWVRNIIRDELREQMAKQVRPRQMLTYAPLSTAAGLLMVVVGLLVVAASALLTAAAAYSHFVVGNQLLDGITFGLAGVLIGVFIGVPGFYIWEKARYKTGDELRRKRYRAGGTSESESESDTNGEPSPS